MQEFIRFLSQGWVGTIVGAGGAALALFLYWRSQIPGMIAFQSHDVSMIGGGDAVFPVEVEVRYRGTPVPKLTSSTIWIWNAGKKTVRGSDVVAHDPFQFRFDGEVLNVKIKKVSREAVQITAAASGEAGRTVCCSFEFLDPGDGGVLEVLHTGSDKAPECTGTIIGLPKGPQHWGLAWDFSVSSKRRRRSLWFFYTTIVILGLIVSLRGILGDQYINEVLPFIPVPSGPQPSSEFLVLLGLLVSSCSGLLMWNLRRLPPSSLDVVASASSSSINAG